MQAKSTLIEQVMAKLEILRERTLVVKSTSRKKSALRLLESNRQGGTPYSCLSRSTSNVV